MFLDGPTITSAMDPKDTSTVLYNKCNNYVLQLIFLLLANYDVNSKQGL